MDDVENGSNISWIADKAPVVVTTIKEILLKIVCHQQPWALNSFSFVFFRFFFSLFLFLSKFRLLLNYFHPLSIFLFFFLNIKMGNPNNKILGVLK